MRTAMPSLLACTLALASACGSDDGATNSDIVNQALSGTVGGQPWTFVTGMTDAFLSQDDDAFFTELYAESISGCNSFQTPAAFHLIVSVPKTVGDHAFSMQGPNGTFVLANNQNMVTFDGHIVVEAVSATEVTAGLRMSYDAQNVVNGRFTATVCAN